MYLAIKPLRLYYLPHDVEVVTDFVFRFDEVLFVGRIQFQFNHFFDAVSPEDDGNAQINIRKSEYLQKK